MTSYLVNKDEISPTPLPIPVAENAEKKILKNTIKQLLNNVWVFPSFFSKYTENLDIAPPAGHSRKRRLNASDSYNLNPLQSGPEIRRFLYFTQQFTWFKVLVVAELLIF